MEINLELPYPPSVNNYWRKVGYRTLISKKGREYKKEVQGLCRGFTPFDAHDRLSVTIYAFPPDRRKRDLDNILKALFDSLCGYVFDDDSQIDEIHLCREKNMKPGKVIVIINKYHQQGKDGSNKHEPGGSKA